MSDAYQKLIKTLRTVFEMDKADLDFGIYRILNQKRAEINQFLEKDLLPQVQAAFADYAAGSKTELHDQLDALIKTLQDAGMDPEQSPKVAAMRKQMGSAIDLTAVENEVYSHLHTFFSRYYDKGDFISQRRYKADTYAIPYEGEEVKLYWANHDQYYIKSSERLRDYAFTVQGHDGKTVRIKLVEADTEKDNVKARADEERRFVLDAEQPLAVVDDELHVRFFYVPVGKKTQDVLNKEAVETIFQQKDFKDWFAALQTKAPTEKNPKRTLLEKHLNDYTARHTFDYFIHKDLGGFLRRELDFYIKNEVLYLDDIDDAAFAVTEQHLRKIKVIRAIALKLIRMLAQLEDFQKKLWLKKKFVVEMQYCITLDRVPEALYPEIAANQAQHDEWVKLFSINGIKKDLENPGYIKPLTMDFLKANNKLVLDTQFFDDGFKDRLLASIEDFDERCDGILINSENYQALYMLIEKYQGRVRCVYIDPPYNTNNDEFIYKDDFCRSSWLTFMRDRLVAAKKLMSIDGVLFISIDDKEYERLKELCNDIFGRDCILNTFSVKTSDPSGHKTVNPSPYSCLEYVLMICKDRSYYSYQTYYIPSEYDSGYNQYIENIDDDYTDWKVRPLPDFVAKSLGYESTREATKKLSRPGFDLALAEFALQNNEKVFQATAISKDAGKEIVALRDKSSEQQDKIFRFTREKDCIFIRNGRQIYFYSNKIKPTLESNKLGPVKPLTNLWIDIPWNGIANEGGVALKNGKKPEKLLYRLYSILRLKEGDIVMDFFVGSGTAAAVSAKFGLKWIAVEGNNDIATMALKRLINISHKDTTGVSNLAKEKPHFFSYFKIESYEDALNNLILKDRTKPQQNLLNENPALREDYLLGYWLDVETADSPSLLNIDQFEDPFNYRLNIATGSVGAFKPTRVDLVETFNYLIGLRVKHTDTLRGFKVITGTNPKDETVLVIWRNLKDQDNAALEAFLNKQKYNPRDTEFDHLYVNGDHALDDPHSKVKMIEIEFKRLMFDVQGV